MVATRFILQLFAAAPAIVSYLVHLHDAPKGADGGPVEEMPLDKVRRAVWGTPHADGVGIV